MKKDNTTKIKLLVFTSTFPKWENDDATPPFVYELSKRLAKTFDISVLTPHCPKSKSFEIMSEMKLYRFRYFFRKYEKLAGNGGIIPTLNRNKFYYLLVPFFLFMQFSALIKIIKKEKPDIIHAHWIIPQGCIAALIKKIYKIPFVVTIHGGDIFGLQGRILTNFKKFTLKNANKITVVSNAIKKEILEKTGKNLEVEVVPMGVDSNLFNPNKKDDLLRKKYKIDGAFLLFVGRLEEKKGVEYLIKAMPDIIKKYPKIKLMIIGYGTLEKKLKNLTKKLYLEKNIIFTGPIQNNLLPKYYASSDIFIGPSIQTKEGDTEGLGLTFVEAGLCNCVLIGSNIGGISDVVENNKTGFLIKQKDSREIAIAVIRLLDNKSLMKKIKSTVRKELINKYDWQIVTNRYKEILQWNYTKKED